MAKKDATTEGVSEDKIPEDRITPQVQAHEELAELHRKRREAGQDKVEDLSPEVELPPDIQPNEPREEIEAAPEPEEQAETTVVDDPDEFETIKVDGEEQKVEKSKVYEAGKRALQKESAADKRLEEATKKTKEADQILEDAKKRAEELNTRKEPEKPEFDKDQMKELVHAIRYSDDDDEATEAAAQLFSNTGAKATGLSKEDIEKLVDSRAKDLADRQQFESALERVKASPEEGGFGDLFDNGMLQNAFGFKDQELQQSHPDWSYEQRLRAAGEAVREKFNLNPTKAVPNNDSKNEARKAQVTRSPTATSVATTSSPQPVKTERQRFQEQLAEVQQTRRPV